jgi:glucose-6-phosphate-specific signal transduction histidine kinase
MVFVTLLLLSLSSFSQTDTNDTARVRLKVPTAMKAAIDLVRYDELRVRDSLHQVFINNQEEIIKRQAEEIADQKGQINRLTMINTSQAGIIQQSDLRYKDLERKYKKEVRAGRFKVVMSVATLAAGAYIGSRIF